MWLGDSEGDITIVDMESVSQERVLKAAHDSAITCMCAIENRFVSAFTYPVLCFCSREQTKTTVITPVFCTVGEQASCFGCIRGLNTLRFKVMRDFIHLK